jgi:NAD(P)-dependent dehydrogenase (short-subunit alcohol dehydrogenase family)
MDLELTDKVAVVTGANKGIGLAITEALVAEGAYVVAGSRSTENLERLDRVTPVPVDLLSDDGPALLVRKAVDEFGRLDVLVNNVGAVRIRVNGFLATSDEEFEWALKINFFTALRAARAALGPMLEAGSGSIVNVASVNSFFQPDAATVDYGVAKAAVVNLSKSLSQEFGPKGIRVNCVSPGQVGTDLWLGEHGVAEVIAEATGTDADKIREAATAAIATGRFTTPQEVATLVTMLASDRTANVTGANYVIDGGLIKTI